MDFKIREIKKSEIPCLDIFLYEAIFIPDGVEKPEKDIVKLPELSRYYLDFGKESDLCLVAELNNELVGAIWTRIFSETEKGYGYVDSKTPELSMSVLKPYRNMGIGKKLLKEMIDRLIAMEYNQVSLSVDKLNFAYGLYQKFGFEIVEAVDQSATMIKRLKE